MSEARTKGFVVLLLTLLTALVFWPATGNDFVFDDQELMLTERRAVGGLTREGLAWAFTSTDIALYAPLARLSTLLDFQLYGANPFGHHLTSVLLHGTASILIFLALAALTGALWNSAAVAALCVVHPLRVEPAAWVSGRADLLAGVFGILALYAWAHYLKRRNKAWAALSLGAFLLGMLSKIIVVTFPFVLLLLDYWPLGRLRPAGHGGGALAPGPDRGRAWEIAALLREKAGLFLVAAALTALSFHILQRSDMVYSLQDYPLLARAATSPISYIAYLGKTFWPSGLTVLYPHRWGSYNGWQVGGAFLLLAAVSAAAFVTARRHPYLPVGWFWFLGMLLPVIGLYQARLYPIADRYMYLPQVGLFIATIWIMARMGNGRGRGGIAASVAALALILACVPVSLKQVGHWKDGLSLFGHAVAVAPDVPLSRYNYGNRLAHAGRLSEAIDQLAEAVRLAPAYADARGNLGMLLADTGRDAEALGHLETYLNLGSSSSNRAFIETYVLMLKQRLGHPAPK